MFENRLKVMLIILGCAAAIILARLFDMQVLHATTYREQAADALLLPERVRPAVRGRILDRTGRELVSDEPSWQVEVHYDALALNTNGVRGWYEKATGASTQSGDEAHDAYVAWFQQRVDAMWRQLATFSGKSEWDLRERGADICEQVQDIHDAVHKNRGFDAKVREEVIAHPILTDLDDQRQLTARTAFAAWPWVSVEDADKRSIHVGPAFVHLIGRTGPVTADVIANDPHGDDENRRYLGIERLGVTGIEKLAEDTLRGIGGRFQKNRRGTILEDEPAISGKDVRLTIRADLQEALYKLLDERIPQLPYSSGAAVVVLDVATRDCLALVSYPGYNPADLKDAEAYQNLLGDTRRLPLRFRAVANQYAPGSIVKPLVCLAGLDSGKIDLDTRFECQGSLFPEHPNSWRCWPSSVTGQRMHHGSLDVTGAIKHSCNVFMYHVGQELGVDTLTGYFDMAGFGHVTSTGLIEETSGINPTSMWLAENRDVSPTPGLGRLYAIGQGEVNVTPVQAANLMAVYASGEYRHVNLIARIRPRTPWIMPGSAEQWRAVRRGLYGVVNDSDGTAHRTAYLDPSYGYALYGKTGSAEAMPWVTSYDISYALPDGSERTTEICASTEGDAIAELTREHPDAAFSQDDIAVATRWPDRLPEHGRKHSHAWFAGYLAPLGADSQPLADRTPPIAFAVLVEFGGSGGRVSAPIGREVARKIIELLGPELDPDAVVLPIASAANGREGP